MGSRPRAPLGDRTNVRTAVNGACNEGAIVACKRPHEGMTGAALQVDEGDGLDQDGHLSVARETAASHRYKKLMARPRVFVSDSPSGVHSAVDELIHWRDD